ncbi:helix-turn-helix domain-containing protein [Nocardioides donggukensis]|uniref:Helix-turn-helix domain-containing protein n=1 Tax=Nocardioides donggukensis TaxID=2774019 RepID=A0A927PZ00_9ACTN|nr:helix-turn-helix domain-containing protein [Nocardioides donggukensis]MBD8869293.1 helix-turn-helix domain-containing protein [Nocardioides donggukensis]
MSRTATEAVTVADIHHLPTVPVDTAARFLGVSRDSAYQAARTGELPTIRIGHRLLVPVPRLLAMVGHD